MRRDKTATYVFSSFVVAGALFFIVGCVIGFRSLNRKNMTAAEAEIVRITTERGADDEQTIESMSHLMLTVKSISPR